MKTRTSTLLRDRPRLLDEALSELMDDITLKRNREGTHELLGIGTGFTDLDRKTLGLRPGQLIAIGGRPFMGKTSLAISIASNVALEQKLPVVIYSMDMSSRMVAERIVCRVGELNFRNVSTGRLTSEDLSALGATLEKLRGAAIYIDDTPALSAKEIYSRTHAFQEQHGPLGLIVVDHLQGISNLNSDDCNAGDYDKVLSSLRKLAQEVDAPVVVLSQLTRRVEKRKEKFPYLSDFPSRAIVQCADLALLLYREEYYKPDTDQQGIADLTVARNRDGEVGNVRLRFDGEHLSFKNLIFK